MYKWGGMPKKKPIDTLQLASGAGAKNTVLPGFPIVGIGASAGGLEALEGLFRAIPDHCGMAFVLVQHLDPGRASMLTAILQRYTKMEVVEVTDNLRVAPDHAYVIPPNRDMLIFDRTLRLNAPKQSHGHRFPIDAFFRSLAEDQAERAIGVILSGTGTDGTEGLRTIVGAGGMTIVQDPLSAKYDGMPTSAIHAGYAMMVLPVEKMPAALLTSRSALTAPKEGLLAPSDPASLNSILQFLRHSTGNDFSKYKRSTIGRRVERRMSLQNIDDLSVYLRFVKENPCEVKNLFRELLINVTSFFRDPEAFQTLKRDVLPNLVATLGAGDTLRAWVVGCATGEEAYTLAILLCEVMEENSLDFKVQIYATDLDFEAVATARAGLYPPNIAQVVSEERLTRFFIKQESGFQVKKAIREMVVFATHNVINDPPFLKIDIITCRNLLIYIEPELQSFILGLFHYSLKPEGILMLSPAESTGRQGDLFALLDTKWKIFRSISTTRSTPPALPSGSACVIQNVMSEVQSTVTKMKTSELSTLMMQALLHSYAPASVLTDAKGNILFVHGETGKFFQPAPGMASFNAIEMARQGLKDDLGTAIQRAAADGTPSINRVLSVKTNGDFQNIALSVRAMKKDAAGDALLLLSFQELSHVKPGRKRAKSTDVGADSAQVEELRQKLAENKENLQAVIKEQQTSNEELRSANEELQSMNEELQSTNEELETSKEELQSTNEELISVNAELQAKIEQLNDMQNDMKNLLDNTCIGTIFLDEQLAIRRYTQDAVKIYRLVPTDVGRPLADIKSDLQGEDLLEMARTVQETLTFAEREIRSRSGTMYLVRIRPYRTLDNVIDGVVLTFTDITSRVSLEAGVEEARKVSDAIIDTVHHPLMVLDDGLRIVSVNPAFYRYFAMEEKNTIGHSIGAVTTLQGILPQLRERLEEVLEKEGSLEGFEVERQVPGNGLETIRLNVRPIHRKDLSTHQLLVAIEVPYAVKKEQP